MREPTHQERNLYGALSSLRLRDVRFDPDNVAHLSRLSNGHLRLRCQTDHSFASGHLVYNDGEAHFVDLVKIDDDDRWRYWEVEIDPAGPEIAYSFAFRLEDGRVYYYGGRGLAHVVESRFHLNLAEMEGFAPPAWAQGAVIYQIFPERFNNGNPALNPADTEPWETMPYSTLTVGGDLPGITAKLDYIKGLGVDVLYLTPIFTSPSNHKYDATDYYNVDPAFGGNEALRDLVAGCHAREMRIILDASFNHCHPTFFAFQDVIKNEEKSAYKDWFTIYDFPIEIGYRPQAVSSERWEDPNFQRYLAYLRRMEEMAGIPIIEKEDEGELFDPTYLAWYGVINMPKLNQKNPAARQYFLDVATYWLTEFDIDGWRMDVAIFVEDDFWQDFRRVCKAAKPDCYLISEIWGDTSHWLQGDMFDATMNYLLRDIALDFLAGRSIDAHEVKTALLRLDAHYAPQVQLAQHNLLSSHDVPRFLRLANEDRAMLQLATVFQMTFPGAPGLYYGDEIGMTGGGDPDNRRTFPWERSESWDNDQLELVKKLTALRREHPVLRSGRWRWLWGSENGDAFAFERFDGARSVEIVLNRGEVAVAYTPRQAGRIDRLSGSAVSGNTIDIPAKSAMLLTD